MGDGKGCSLRMRESSFGVRNCVFVFIGVALIVTKLQTAEFSFSPREKVDLERACRVFRAHLGGGRCARPTQNRGWSGGASLGPGIKEGRRGGR